MLKRAVFFVLLSCASAIAQTGEITGRITDPGGAVVPDVRMTITETSTGVRRLLRTNAEGYYSAPSLLPGPYSIGVEHQAFKPITSTGLQLQADQQLRVDFTLEVGAVTERITVHAEAALLETDTQSAVV